MADPIDKIRDDETTETAHVHERNGVWVVTIDGAWYGDYLRRDDAVAAVSFATSLPNRDQSQQTITADLEAETSEHPFHGA
jgi:hypothetical protein